MMLVAVDPGSSSGAIAVREEFGHIAAANLPSTPKDIYEYLLGLQSVRGLYGKSLEKEVYLENVGGARPGNASRGARTFATHMGHLEMACLACQLPVIKVTPQKWLRGLFGDAYPKGDHNKSKRKTYIYEKMQERWPQIKFTKRQADAVAILTWAMKQEKE